jgi:hypothetical protein
VPGKPQVDHPAIGNPVIRSHAGCRKQKNDRNPNSN